MTNTQEDNQNDRVSCQRFSRIVGYYRPLDQWNEGMQSQWNDRLLFTRLQN